MDKVFKAAFGIAPEFRAASPGRVNLLGEHIDYSAGLVLPMALPLEVRVCLAPSTDSRQEDRIASSQFRNIRSADVNEPRSGQWDDYVRGGLQAARALGWATGGYCVYLESDVPHGAGLSTSAAVIVSALKALAPPDISLQDIAILARKVENDFIGVPCGIMDQMAVALARPGQVLALETLSLDTEIVPLPSDWKIAVIHSGVSRELADGRYGERREEILAAARGLGVEWLCHGDLDEVSKLPQPLRRRARHVISEDARARAALRALKAKDRESFALMMNYGHASIRDDFEITTPEVDAIVETALKSGALAARQTGGGFGGCIVLLLDAAAGDEWWARTHEAHPATRLIV